LYVGIEGREGRSEETRKEKRDYSHSIGKGGKEEFVYDI
jgi:hypothetical protein